MEVAPSGAAAQAAGPASVACRCGRQSTQRWPAARSGRTSDAKKNLATTMASAPRGMLPSSRRWPPATPHPQDSSRCWQPFATESSRTYSAPLDPGRRPPPWTPLKAARRRSSFRKTRRHSSGTAMCAPARTTPTAEPAGARGRSCPCPASCGMSCCLWNRSWQGPATSPTVPSRFHNPRCQSFQPSSCRRPAPGRHSPALGPRACGTQGTWQPPATHDRAPHLQRFHP